MIDDLPYYDETVRAAIRDAISAATPDTTVAVGSIWEQLPTPIRLRILFAHSCKTLNVPNTLNPRIRWWEYPKLIVADIFSSPFPRRGDFKQYPNYVVGFVVFWTAVVIVIGRAVLAVASC